MTVVYTSDAVRDEGGAGRAVVAIADIGGDGKSAYQRVNLRLQNEGGFTVENIPLSPASAVTLARNLLRAARATFPEGFEAKALAGDPLDIEMGFQWLRTFGGFDDNG